MDPFLIPGMVTYILRFNPHGKPFLEQCYAARFMIRKLSQRETNGLPRHKARMDVLGSSLHKPAARYYSKLSFKVDSEVRGGNRASSLWADTGLLPGDHLGKE